ncbi:MAG: tyrosine-type recombinase/integrase [Candidatus Nanoarchaeia archaeon]|nr:tyrosine-type recombinase/integrase [Candidatus Nanoarchaeia archaeon]
MEEKQVLKEYYNLQTCSQIRINKIKNVLTNSRKIIKKDLTRLKITDVTALLKYINNSDYKLWTKNDYKKIFKAFLKWYYKEEFFKWNEDKLFREGFKTSNYKKAFNKSKINKNTLIKPEEFEKILKRPKPIKINALLTLLYESAFRPCEIVILRWENLIFDDSQGICSITIQSPKTKETRTIPVKDCVIHLKRWREQFQFLDRKEQDYVFPSQHYRDKHLSPGTITTIISRLCKEAGIRHLFPYMFRHSRIYEIQKKLGAKIACRFAGHSLEVSEIYNHLDDSDVEEAMLEKIFITKELTPEEQNKMEKQIEDLKQSLHQTTTKTNEQIKMMEDWQILALKYMKINPEDKELLKSLRPKSFSK